MHPVGPRSAGVYWFRRILVALVVVAVVAAIGWWVLNRGSGPTIDPAAATVTTSTPKLTGVLAAETSTEDTVLDSDTSSDADSSGTGTTSAPTTTAATVTTAKTTAAKTTAPTTTKAPAKTTSAKTTPKTTGTPSTKAAAKTTGSKAPATPKTTTPKTTSPPKPSYDANGNLICADSAIRITAITQGGTVFPAGSQPRLGMTVTNTGKATCVRDVSGTLQVYTVYTAAGARVWSTADCFPGEGHEVRSLAPGSSASFIIKWSGTTSNPGCTAARVRVKPGEYKVVATLGKLPSKPLAFTMR